MIILNLALLPTIIFLYFIYRKDKLRKEPIGQIAKGFGFGAISALLSFTISLPLGVLGFYPEEAYTVVGHINMAFFGAAIPEELAKFFMLWLLLRHNKYYDEHVDGIVYAVCVGMGFAALENVLYMISNYESWIQVGIVRALCPVPGHFFFAVMMGYFYSRAMLGDPAKKKVNICFAILVPIALHAAFDSLLMISDMGMGIGVACITLFIGLFVFMAISTRGKYKKLLEIDKAENKVDDGA